MALGALLLTHKAAAVLAAVEAQLQLMALCMAAVRQEIQALVARFVSSGPAQHAHSHQLALAIFN
jgi:hypothetical protein